MLTRKLSRPGHVFCSWIVFAILLHVFGFYSLGQTADDKLSTNSEFLSKRISQHIAAGEFPSAQNLIAQLPAEQQDDFRTTLFRLQITSGAARGAAMTALSFNQDELRNSELARLRSRYQGYQGSDEGNSGDNVPTTTLDPDPVLGGQGGITESDFEPLIDLITDTIAPSKWQDQDGSFSIRSFPAGVFVDHSATLQKLKVDQSKFSELLSNKPATSSSLSNWFEDSGNRNANWKSELRMVSLNRLERAAEIQHAMGMPFDNTMMNLAGLTEVKYVFVDREKREIVIAGPAGPWHHDSIGRAINSESGRPVMQLEDFVVVLRNAFYEEGKFGCSIDPRPDNLAAVQEFLLKPKKANLAWKKQLRETMGLQDIAVFGIDPRTHAARVLVEADHHMKLVGMGLQPSIPEVPSYLDRLEFDPQNPNQPSDVVRWWFAANEASLACDEHKEYFDLTGASVRVLSESEILGLNGERRHTGKSTGPTQGFAKDFSKHFSKLAVRYPVYQELQSVFNLALVANLIRLQHLDKRCDRELTFFKGSDQKEKVSFQNQESTPGQSSFPIRLSKAPKQVASVMNEQVFEHRQAGKTLRNTVFSVSGGVEFDVAALLKSDRLRPADTAAVESIKQVGELEKPVWWWD